MKSTSVLFALALGALAACSVGTKVVLPPVTPEDVEIIARGEEPAEDFEEIANIRQQATMDTPRSEIVARAREKAAKLGADALLIKEYRLNQSSMNPTITLLAVAIYYPSRHPELGGEPH